MLKLVNTTKKGVCYPLLVDVKYVVGRKAGDIKFPDDQSVSRTHAELIVEHPAGNITEPMLTPVLTLTDMGSKFGTFATEENINAKVQANAREPVTLAIADKVRFGLQWNEYRIEYTPFVLTSSSYKATSDFKAKIAKIGGHFISDWTEDVTHLVMENLTLTVKAVCSLLAAKPIVTPAFLTDLVTAIEAQKDPPDPKHYLPPVIEKGMTGLPPARFHANAERTTLFLGKTFLFCTSKHFKKISAAVLSGGGTAKLVSDMRSSEDIKSDDIIIMGHPLDIADGEKEPRVKMFLDIYRKAGKRFIADSEIGMAAVHNSIEKHCNPKCDINSLVLPTIPTQTQENGSVPIVPETQEVDESRVERDNSVNVVNETVHEKESPPRSRDGKRSIPESETCAPSSKKRSAGETLSNPEPKRAKGSTSQDSNLSRNRPAASQKSSKNKKLNSLFNFSSSEDEDEVEVVPESQPNPGDEEGEMEVSLPDSQRPMVRVRNLQSLASTQSSLAEPMISEDDVVRVPASPEDSENEEILVRPKGTDFVQTVTTTIMNAKTVPVSAEDINEDSEPESTPKKTVKRGKTAAVKLNESNDGEVAGPSKKRRREDDSADNLVEKTKKINLEDQSVKREIGFKEVTLRLPLVKKPLVNKNLTLDASMFGTKESYEGRKNFKSFKKVLPTFVTLDSSTYQENSRGETTFNESSSGSSSKSVQVKLTNLIYYPGTTYSDTNGVSENKSRGNKPAKKVINAAGIIANCRRQEMNQPEETTTPPNDANEPEPSTSRSARRVSPRKKGPAIKFPTPAPPPPPVMQDVSIEEDDEDEDDLWTFDR